jgi:hypothetical protein
LRITENLVYLEEAEIPTGITLQGMADLLAPHFHGDRAMHHYMIREVADQVILAYVPETTEERGTEGPFCCLNGWGRADDPFFEGDDEVQQDDPKPQIKKTRTTFASILNQLREERGLPRARRVRTSEKPKITRAVVREICAQVWKEKYPRALTDADYVLGDFTAKLVEQEVERRIAILKGELIPLKR